MKPKFWLPAATKANKKAIEAILQHQDLAADAELGRRAVAWTLNYWYLQGLRQFRVSSPLGSATPELTVQDRAGHREIRVEKALVQARVEMGRLLGIDVSPAVKRRVGLTLAELREAATAQAALDAFYAMTDARLKASVVRTAVMYGTGALGLFESDYEPNDLLSGLELQVIPPWELRPLPGNPGSEDQVGGLTWTRMVPLEALKERYGHILKFREDRVEVVEMMPGENSVLTIGGPTAALGSIGGGSSGSQFTDRPPGASRSDDEGGEAGLQKYVCLSESWLYDGRQRVSRWLVRIDRELVLDIDFCDRKSPHYQEERPLVPIHPFHYLNVGAFWSRSFADIVIPLNRELEYLIGEMVQNLREADKMRFTAIPSSAGVNARNLKAILRDRFLFYNRDPDQANHGIEVFGPPNTGDLHGRAINAISALLEQVGAQGELYYGGVPGRVDAASALAHIEAAQQVPLAVFAQSVKAAYSGIYRKFLDVLRRRAARHPQAVIPLTRLDATALGLRLDASGKLVLDQNPVPNPLAIDITIASEQPRYPAEVQRRLDQWKADGTISPVEYRILVILEGLPVQPLNREEYYQYQKMWSRAIRLFGDGETPGTITVNDFSDNAIIGWKVMKEAMATEAFDLASEAVQRKYIEVFRHYQEAAGPLPSQQPSLDSFGNMVPPNQEALMAAGLPPGLGLPGLPMEGLGQPPGPVGPLGGMTNG